MVYCRSVVYPRLLSEYLSELWTRRAIGFRWQVSVTFSAADNADTAFSIEPALGSRNAPSLPSLRADAATITGELVDAIRKRAGSQIAVLRRRSRR